tara:strand:+ start:5030 stop:5149 length:120 start_codon:yes stop_codon:yes gene_type:complete
MTEMKQKEIIRKKNHLIMEQGKTFLDMMQELVTSWQSNA